MNESGAWIGKVKRVQRIARKGNWRVELARAFAFISPGAEELKRRRRRLRFWRGSRAISARSEEEYGEQRGVQKSPSQWFGIYFCHSANLRSEIV